MQKYQYTGKNSEGKSVSGTIEAANTDTVAANLIESGITPLKIEVVEEQEDQLETIKKKLNLQLTGPSLSDLAMLSRQMYSLTRSGVPIIRAIRVVTQSATNQKLRNALQDIVTSIEGGKSLAASMSEHKKIFPNLMIALVNVGENTGALDEVFAQVSVHFEREIDTRKRLKTATRYPSMVIIAISIAIAVINLVVVPAFKNFFDRFGESLPLPTIILIATSDFMVNYWHLLLVVIIAGVVGIIMYIKTPPGHWMWDRWKLQIPLVGRIIEKALLARFARAFALATRSGVPLLDAIQIVATATDNIYVGAKIMDMKSGIEHGESLTKSADKSKMFTPLVLQMIAIGEETGEVDRLLDEVAEFYEKELDYDLKRLGDAIEPILISVIAVMVLILALGVFLPMWDISKISMSKS